MKFTAVLLFLVAVIMAVAGSPFVDKHRRPGNGGIPTFPGQGPFNPKLPSGPWGKPGIDQAVSHFVPVNTTLSETDEHLPKQHTHTIHLHPRFACQPRDKRGRRWQKERREYTVRQGIVQRHFNVVTIGHSTSKTDTSFMIPAPIKYSQIGRKMTLNFVSIFQFFRTNGNFGSTLKFPIFRFKSRDYTDSYKTFEFNIDLLRIDYFRLDTQFFKSIFRNFLFALLYFYCHKFLFLFSEVKWRGSVIYGQYFKSISYLTKNSYRYQ
ncbi:uncharacterized protein [Fopius arisanus]|uniref:Uncharacterized protein n=2 Tax=Fopius arisanus TaxID=64838 RepID=A0A9R1TGT5_9HYME|nr:PREDICTED: uncharacterized protein LOC105270119 [Fopius arisanus]